MREYKVPAKGKRLGDFEIVGELGRGGMGIVYEARQLSLNRPVAVKVLPNSIGMTQTARQRFHREAQAAGKLHHTHIVAVYAEGEDNGICYFAMELLEGLALDRVIANLRESGSTMPGRRIVDETLPFSFKPPKEESFKMSPGENVTSRVLSSRKHFVQVARWMADVADALDYAHKQGVIHRDVKPANLMLGSDDRIRLMDFGLARMLEEPGMTHTGELLGTPRYMSPEQIIAGRMRIDHRTDVYSLGVTLFELLTLQSPFLGETRDQLIAQIINKDPQRPRYLNRHIPVDLETICMKAIDRDPDRRFQTASQFADDLRRFINRQAITAKRIGPVGRVIKWVRRRPALAASIFCVLLAMFGAGMLAWRTLVVEAQRVTERRQHLRETAILETMTGNFPAAEEAIREAEQLGVSAAWVHVLRGHAALHRDGDASQAISHFEQAILLEPRNAAAYAMLHYGYLVSGNWMKYVNGLEQLRSMELASFEDFFFVGQCVSYGDPEWGLQLLDEANNHKKTAVGYLTTADARTNYAWFNGDADQAERAVQEATIAQDMLDDSLEAACMRIWGHLVAATIYRSNDNTPQVSRHMLLAGELQSALPPFGDRGTNLPLHLFARGFYFDYQDNGQESLDFYSDMAKSGHLTAIKLCMYNLYRQRRYKEAIEVYDRLGKRLVDNSIEVSRAFILLELGEKGRAEALEVFNNYAELSRTSDSLPFHPTVYYAGILNLLGRQEDSRAFLANIRSKIRLHPVEPEWYDTQLDYLCGKSTDKELQEAAGVSLSKQAEAQFQIGLSRIASGERPLARDSFRKAKLLGLPPHVEWYWGWAFLQQLREDPEWPKWIVTQDGEDSETD